jgi:lysozyme
MNTTLAVAIIRRFEGIMDGDPSTVNLDPYLCPAGYWTIGWGHVVLDGAGRPARSKAEAQSIYQGGITLVQAEAMLAVDVSRFAKGVESKVKAGLKENQFCALVSFAFNVGLWAFENSTLLRRVNAGEFDDVPTQFLRWTKIKGAESRGLRNRRLAEVELWGLL